MTTKGDNSVWDFMLHRISGSKQQSRNPIMIDENNKNIKSDRDEVENLFNVQFDELKPQFLDAEDGDSCCCPKDKNHIKISARLKKSSNSPTEQEYEEIVQEPTCNCECQDRDNGNKIRRILGGLENKKLKISLRL